MLVAKDKKQNNIAEYVLYMWQVEDTMRAMDFNMTLIEERLIVHFKQPEKVKDDIRDWYTNLILSMHEENIKEAGHLQIVNGVLAELHDLHKRLVVDTKNEDYLSALSLAKGNIDTFRQKLRLPEANDIEVCFNGLYGLLLLRLKKKEITEETTSAMNTFSKLLSLLSQYYHNINSGKIEL